MTKHRDKVATRSGGQPPRQPLPSALATTSREPGLVMNPTYVPKKRCIDHIYDRDTKEFFGRTCKNWAKIIVYSIMYLIFLSTYTLIFLFLSLFVLKLTIEFKGIDKTELLTYSEHGIGLTAVPTSQTSYPLISYKKGDCASYKTYVLALDELLARNRRKRAISDLGPCGEPPYGYGDKPCVIIKINRQLSWTVKPLQANSTAAAIAPAEVLNRMKGDKKKLWLKCDGYHSYDREHIRSIKYYPDPPGFDPDVFPLKKDANAPLVAVQISNFTVGLSLAVECKLWYDMGPSSVEFVLYVAPEIRNKTKTSDNV